MRIEAVQFHMIRTPVQQTPHKGLQSFRIVQICSWPVPFPAPTQRQQQRRRTAGSRKPLKMRICHHQAILFAQHNGSDQPVMRMSGIAMPFFGQVLPADHIDKIITSRRNDLRYTRSPGPFQPRITRGNE